MPTLICRHIKANGARCSSPALREQVFCYFHNDSRRRHHSLSPFDDDPAIIHPVSADHREKAQREPIYAEYYGLHPKRGPVELEFPPLEDRESVQLALSMVITALATNRIDAKRATPLIYALQVASQNAKDLKFEPSRDILVTEVVPTPAGINIAPDEDSVKEIRSREFYQAWLAEEAAREAEENEDDDDDDKEEESVTSRYLRDRLAASI